MQEINKKYSNNKLLKWLYIIIIIISISIVAMITAISYGLIIGFDVKKSKNYKKSQVMLNNKKFEDFYIKLTSNEYIKDIKYTNNNIIIHIKDDINKKNLIVILDILNGNETGRFILY